MEDIFIKKERKKTNKILQKELIMASIPDDALTEPDNNLAKSFLEVRWRIFKLPNIDNEIIEISKKIPGQNRLYTDKKGKWVEHDDDTKYDKYIIKKYYHYQNIN